MLVLSSWEGVLDVQGGRGPGIPLVEEPVDALEPVLDERELLAATLRGLFEIQVHFQIPTIRESVGQFARVAEEAFAGERAGGGQRRGQKGDEPMGPLHLAWVER